ncbi:hypothetical protein KIH86_27315, partial [Paenibacillus sp. HN-1]
DYHYWRAVDAAERAAKACGRLLIPTACLHWQRKTRLEDRRVQIAKTAFYCLEAAELTGLEYDKYLRVAREDEGVCLDTCEQAMM